MIEVSAVLAQLVGGVRFTAYDGSQAGPAGAPVTVHVRSRRALAHLVSAPGELGFARAYVSGELDLEAADHMTALQALRRRKDADLTVRERVQIAAGLGREALVPVAPPPEEVGARRLLAGLVAHSRGRDAVAIRHHYDVSNRFYEWVLGPSMAYTCAVYPHEQASLDEAQAEKFDLVCRKLDLQPGMRLLDVGCGWGGMVRHAARHYGVQALGVTLSRSQAEWAQKAVADEGLTRPGRGAPRATTATSRRAVSTPSARSGSPSTWASPSCRATPTASPTGCAPGAGCSTTASPGAASTCRRSPGAASSPGSCSPTASCRR